MKFFVNQFLIFILYAFIGWIGESFYCSYGAARKRPNHHFKWINRGFLSGPIVPLYGAGGIAMGLILMPLRGKYVLCGLAGLVVCDVIEYITSYVMEKLFHRRWWDYTGKFLSIKGRICLRNSLIWGFGSVIFITFIHPPVLRLIEGIPWELRISAFIILFSIFMFDFVRTVITTISIVHLQAKISRTKSQMSSLKDMMSVENIKSQAAEQAEKLRDSAASVVEAQEEIRSSLNHTKGWVRHRTARLFNEDYPVIRGQLLDHGSEVMEQLHDFESRSDMQGIFNEMKFLRMDFTNFMADDRYEMY